MTSRELFERAIEVVLGHEGSGSAVHPNDRGGLTRFGISQRWNPDIDVLHITREQAIEFYWERYWKAKNYDWLPPAIAVKVFDLSTNLGEQSVVRCLQRALRACGYPVKIDGILGPKTAGAALNANPLALLAALRSEAAADYKLIVANDMSQAAFLTGWLNRAYS